MVEQKSLFIRASQDYDIRFAKHLSQHGEIGYFFYCSADSFHHDVDSQDYLILRSDPDKFFFAVCDGVGQSYFGQLAAEFLGEYLFEWLQTLDIKLLRDSTQTQQTAIELTGNLQTIVEQAQEMVIQHELPGNLPDLQVMALQEQKNYGSETVFVAGRVDFDNTPKQSAPVLNLFWLGDAQFHLYDVNGIEVSPEKWNTKERWSTKRGIKGVEVVHARQQLISPGSRLVVHSDGIKSLSEQLFNLPGKTPDEVQSIIRSLRSAPDSDDISLVSFTFPPKKTGFWSFHR